MLLVGASAAQRGIEKGATPDDRQQFPVMCVPSIVVS
jgi:hypothetical protein